MLGTFNIKRFNESQRRRGRNSMNRKAIVIRLKILIRNTRKTLFLLEQELQSIISDEEKKS